MFEQRIKEWTEKVISAYNHRGSGIIEIGRMILDVDKIISEGFDTDPIFEENV